MPSASRNKLFDFEKSEWQIIIPQSQIDTTPLMKNNNNNNDNNKSDNINKNIENIKNIKNNIK